MKCLHCLIEFHENQKLVNLGEDADAIWEVLVLHCHACERFNLFLIRADQAYVTEKRGHYRIPQAARLPIRPQVANRPCPPEVPTFLCEDFQEACATLPYSAKASAALSRRCLQNLLRDAAGVKPNDLSKEIQEVLDEMQLPTHLADMVDAVRNIGNFAAHPIKSQHTGEILPVESEEAEWNLDVIEALFDFYYVQPAAIAKKRDALNNKLKEAGKPPMKQ